MKYDWSYFFLDYFFPKERIEKTSKDTLLRHHVLSFDVCDDFLWEEESGPDFVPFSWKQRLEEKMGSWVSLREEFEVTSLFDLWQEDDLKRVWEELMVSYFSFLCLCLLIYFCIHIHEKRNEKIVLKEDFDEIGTHDENEEENPIFDSEKDKRLKEEVNQAFDSC